MPPALATFGGKIVTFWGLPSCACCGVGPVCGTCDFTVEGIEGAGATYVSPGVYSIPAGQWLDAIDVIAGPIVSAQLSDLCDLEETPPETCFGQLVMNWSDDGPSTGDGVFAPSGAASMAHVWLCPGTYPVSVSWRSGEGAPCCTQNLFVMEVTGDGCYCEYGWSDVTITYSWPSGQNDLDTRTTFLGGDVGHTYGLSTEYMELDGDNVGAGPEIVTVKLERACAYGAIEASPVTIALAADWYPPAGGSGTATVTVTNGVNTISQSISPGTRNGATTSVGVVQVEADGTLSFL